MWVRSVARQGVFSQRMHSFIGRNAQYRVTPCLENLGMSGNYRGVREMSGISLIVRGNIFSWKIVWLIIFHFSVVVDGTGFYDVIIMKSLSLNMNLTVWSLTLTLVVQAWYEYQLKWSGVPRIVRELSGNFVVSGEWSPFQYCASLVGVSLDNLSAVNKRSTWSYLRRLVWPWFL